MNGRPPIPNEIKKIKGTHEPSRDKENQMTPYGEMHVSVPEDLEPREVEIWRGFVEYLNTRGMQDDSFLHSAYVYAQYWIEYVDCEEFIKKNGRSYSLISTSGSETFKPYPEVSIRDKAWSECQKVGDRFGFDPAYMTKISMGLKKDDYVDPADSMLNV